MSWAAWKADLSKYLVQVRKETLPWLADLVEPLIAGTPEPLQDTVPPQQLGDPDSRWIEVDGVNLHYKDTGPQAPGTPAVLLLHGFNGSVFSWYRRCPCNPLHSLQFSSCTTSARYILTGATLLQKCLKLKLVPSLLPYMTH